MMGPEEETLLQQRENNPNWVSLREMFTQDADSRRFQLLEDLTIEDSKLITFPAGEIVNIYWFGPGKLKIQQFTGGRQHADIHDPNLRILAREIVPFRSPDDEEDKEKAIDNLQKTLNLTREDLLFLLATFPANNPAYQLAEATKYADLFGSDRDKAPLEAIRAERGLRNAGSKIFYEKFGKDRYNKIFDATIDDIQLRIEIMPASHGYWDFKITTSIGGKEKSMQWGSGENSSPLHPSGNNYFTAEFLELFGKESAEHLFNYLMNKLPAYSEK